MASNSVSVYTIFDHPKDFPDVFVCRRFESLGDPPRVLAREVVGTGKTLEEVRRCLPKGLVWMPPSGWDDPKIVETWF
jgi:hypothetical protein